MNVVNRKIMTKSSLFKEMLVHNHLRTPGGTVQFLQSVSLSLAVQGLYSFLVKPNCTHTCTQISIKVGDKCQLWVADSHSFCITYILQVQHIIYFEKDIVIVVFLIMPVKLLIKVKNSSLQFSFTLFQKQDLIIGCFSYVLSHLLIQYYRFKNL